MGLIHDPEAEARSLMMKQKTICDGEKHGQVCTRYMRLVQKVESNNPDSLREGMRGRMCLISPGYPIEFSADEVPVQCSQYEARRMSLPKRVLKSLKIISDPYAYDAQREKYNPLTPEEIKELQKGATEIPGLAPVTQEQIEKMNKEIEAAPVASLDEALEEDKENNE